jgi:hypothetical protein
MIGAERLLKHLKTEVVPVNDYLSVVDERIEHGNHSSWQTRRILNQHYVYFGHIHFEHCDENGKE